MINGVHHFGVTVRNLDKALDFFCNLLGLELVETHEASGERPETILGMPGASLRIAVLKTPDGKNLELIEYVQPKGKEIDLKTCNFGVPHIALIVNDIQKIHDELSVKGYVFNSPPYWKGESVAGQGWGVSFLKGPDGISIELMQPPKSE
jgi:catechol 2,3-dioxygenase-like lactoylglutathione lyase family enzyme